MKLKTLSALLLLAAVQAISYAAPGAPGTPAAPSAQVGVEIRDPTGLVGKTVTPPARPKDSDASLRTYGNDYYDCSGGMIGGAKSDISISILRKGVKTSCVPTPGKKPVALMRHSNSNKSYEFLDAMEVNVPKGFELLVGVCTGADLAVSKTERSAQYYTKHAQAWKVVDSKLVLVDNLKAVKCENEGYGL